ncbi:hypothetical protein BgiMline_002457, partial [Biomphalaria glabrata]
ERREQRGAIELSASCWLMKSFEMLGLEVFKLKIVQLPASNTTCLLSNLLIIPSAIEATY